MMSSPEFRSHFVRLLRDADRAERFEKENEQLKARLKQAEDQIMWLKPGQLHEPPDSRGKRIDMVFRIDQSCIMYRTDAKAYIEEAAETCKRELFQKIGL